MKDYLKKGLMVCTLMFGILLMVGLNDTLYAANKKVKDIDAVYEGVELQVGDEIDPKDIKVIITFDDGTTELLGTQEFDLILPSGTFEIEDVKDGDRARVSYGNKWTLINGLDIVGSGHTIDDEEDRKLLSISATYVGGPVSIGGMANKRDFIVKANYRVYYKDGSTNRITEELEQGWTVVAHTITAGDNDVTLTYKEGNERKSCTVVVPSSGTDGSWVRDGDAWKYRYDDSTYLIGDWIKSGGKWYYMDEHGYMMNRCMAEINGETYYFDDTGVMQTGWVYLKRNWYFFDSQGRMQKEWVYTGGNWYYMDNDGIMLTEWKFLDGEWYFFDEKSGAMQTGWLLRSYTWFFLNDKGMMQTGWIYTGGKWYFMDHGGAMLTNTWVGNCFVDGSGVWVKTR